MVSSPGERHPKVTFSPEGPILRPYIKLHLYPFKAAKKKTQPIESGTDLNPSFDAHFKFRVSKRVYFGSLTRPKGYDEKYTDGLLVGGFNLGL